MKTISYKTFLSLVTGIGICVGLVYLYPDARFIAGAGTGYKGIAPIEFSDQTLYLGRLNAVYKGEVASRNPAIYEHRRDPVIMPAFSEFLEASAGRALHLNIARLDMAATFLLSALLFALVALFAYDLTGLVYASVAAGLGVLFGTHLFSRLFLFGGRIFNASYTLPLWFSRPITPQTHFIFFLLAFIFVYKAIRQNRPALAVAAGIFTGALFYISVFYWVYLYTVIGVLAIIYMARRDIPRIKTVIGILAIASIVSIPYWLENLKTMKDAQYGFLLYRFNIALTHRPIFPLAAVALLAGMLIWRRQIRAALNKEAFSFMAAMLAAIMITLNQQVLTGKLFKESHWTTYTGKFAIIVIGMSLITIGAVKMLGGGKARVLVRNSAAVLFLVLISAHAIGLQENYYRSSHDNAMRLQAMEPVLSWLNTNASSEDVILPSPSDIRLSELIPVYTKSFVYYSEPFFCLSLISADETRYRMLAAYRLFDFSLGEAARHPYAWDGALFLTSDTNRGVEFTNKARGDFSAAYGKALEADGLALAKRYKVDYIVAVTGKDDAVVERLAGAGFPHVYRDNQFTVIKVGERHG